MVSPKPKKRTPPPSDSKSSNKRLFIVSLVFIPALGVGLFWIYQRYVVYPALITTKSHLPLISNTSIHQNDWGTYRSNLYFGMRQRRPTSPLFGMMWFTQPIGPPQSAPAVRHWCDQGDGLKSYGWTHHNGRNFGRQKLVEKSDLSLQTDWISEGGTWTARITMVAPQTTLVSLIFYLSVQEQGAFFTQKFENDKLIGWTGYSPETGLFHLTVSTSKDARIEHGSFVAIHQNPYPDPSFSKEMVFAGMGYSNEMNQFILTGFLPAENPPSKPNFVALQLNLRPNCSVELRFAKAHEEAISGDEFDKEFTRRLMAFDERFESAFGLTAKSYPDFYQDMGRYAISNMLGGIGYFYGHNLVQGKYNSQPVPYGPHELFTAVPSRPFFPRGFIWDEGFHNLLILRFDRELSFEIISSWLDTMNDEGWIPREMILGIEAERRVPIEFVVQRNSAANPPAFFYLISQFLDDEKFVSGHGDILRRMYPRLKQWYQWLNTTQRGPEPLTFRWRGRNETTQSELNAKTLPSGLDDYPRASHPNHQEYHLDLRCWMTMAARVLARLAKITADPEMEQIEQYANVLENFNNLNKRHWSKKTGRYSDYGLHTRNVRLVKPDPVIGPDGRPRPPLNPEMRRIADTEPQLRFVADTFGYNSLFPLMLRLLPADSEQLGTVLGQLTDEELLWTPHGLRSLAKSSPLYNKHNTEHDPPYWRGSIWINANYLVLSALRHYAQTTGPHQAIAFKVYSDLRSAVVSNIAREFKRTGYLWEHYNDETGRGEGTHPFTGWTSLVLLIMGEQYD